MNRLRDVCYTYATLPFEALPEDVVQLARLEVANMLAAGLWGHRHGLGDRTRQLREDRTGPHFAFGSCVSDPSTACFVNAAASMVHDFDDYLYMGHTGHSAVFAALAAGDAADASLETVLKAVVVSNEIQGRLGASTALGPHNGQMWAFIHRAGAAAAAAVVRDLDPESFFHAVNLSLYAPPHPNLAGFMGGDAKYFTAANPASNGLRLASLAAEGTRGYAEIYDAEGGFLDEYAYLPLPELMDGAGEAWFTRSLAFKPYPGCAYLQAPVHLLTEMISDEGFGAADVERITADVSLLTLLMEHHSDPYRTQSRLAPVTVTFSVALSLAIVLREGTLSPAHLTDNYLTRHVRDVQELGERVRLRHRWNETFNTLEGIHRGIDLNPLLANKGWTNVVAALRRMRRQHGGPSALREGMRLLTSGQLARIRTALRSPLEWNSFDVSRAAMERVRFNFGCELSVVLRDGRTLRRSLRAHPGAGDENPSKQRGRVRDKLGDAAEVYFPDSSRGEEIFQQLHRPVKTDLNDLLECLRR